MRWAEPALRPGIRPARTVRPHSTTIFSSPASLPIVIPPGTSADVPVDINPANFTPPDNAAFTNLSIGTNIGLQPTVIAPLNGAGTTNANLIPNWNFEIAGNDHTAGRPTMFDRGHIDHFGIDVTDDCGRSNVPATTDYSNGGLAVATTDALGLFLNEIRRHPQVERILCGHAHRPIVVLAEEWHTSWSIVYLSRLVHERGWGERGSYARDYIRDESVHLGSSRIGPDLRAPIYPVSAALAEQLRAELVVQGLL